VFFGALARTTPHILALDLDFLPSQPFALTRVEPSRPAMDQTAHRRPAHRRANNDVKHNRHHTVDFHT
jgi:hypothetical protein